MNQSFLSNEAIRESQSRPKSQMNLLVLRLQEKVFRAEQVAPELLELLQKQLFQTDLVHLSNKYHVL